MQVFESARHVVTLPFEFEQKVPAAPVVQPGGAASQVQVPFGLEPVHDWCVGQAAVEATKKQPSASLPQTDFDDVDAQNVVVSFGHCGSTLQAQVAAPAAPVQVVWTPQAIAAPVAKKQPSESCAQFVRVLPPEQNWPVAVHVVALHWHEALPPAATQAE